MSGEDLYEWSAAASPSERLLPVSVLPGETSVTEGALGLEDSSVRHAVSEDGSRVFWSTSDFHLYMRDLTDSKTLRLDMPEAGCLAKNKCSEEGGAFFQIASADGSRVFFTDTQRLTADAGTLRGDPDLYECLIVEEAAGPRCQLSDLTPAPGLHQGADVQGDVVGASEDGSWVYFVANGALAPGAGTGDCKEVGSGRYEGQCNLYVHHEGVTRLVATAVRRRRSRLGWGQAGQPRQA